MDNLYENLEQKKTEIKVNPEVREDEYTKLQKENFKKQHERYMENEKRKSALSNDEWDGREIVVDDEGNPLLIEVLEEKREEIKENMPEVLPEEIKQTLISQSRVAK